jgi:hypothetical protein
MKKENINEVFNTWFSNKMDSVHTILPGQVVNYEGHTTRKAEVKIMVQLRNVHNQIIDIAPIKNVPVIFPSTKNFNMLFPLKKGDGCLLVFAESSIGNYLLNATDNAKEADDLNRFDLSDCICIPGLWSFANLPDTSTLNSTDFWLQFQNGTINITDTTNDIILKTTTGKIKIESSGNITFDDGTESYVLGDLHKTALLALNSAIAAITPAGSSAANIAAIQAAFSTFNGTLANMLSTQIKGK